MGDINPNQKSFIFNAGKRSKEKRAPVQLGYVTKKVHNAILAILDMYFACKCNEYTHEQTIKLDKLGTIMEAHVKVLWNLKQAIMYEKPRAILIRKLHSDNHIGQHIRMFGPIALADTADFKSAYKYYTSGLWRQTSKKLCSQAHEMHTASVI